MHLLSQGIGFHSLRLPEILQVSHPIKLNPLISPTKEVETHSRNVSIKLKANSAAEFTRTLEKEIIPLLRKQKGFQDEISFIAPERNEAVAISFWDRKDNADAYSRETYPGVLKTLSKVVEGTPRVESFEVANSTSHQIAAQAI